MSENGGNERHLVKGSNGSDAETAESEPCVARPKGKGGPRAGLVRRCRDRVAARTGLTRRGVYFVEGLVVFAVVAVVVVVALACAWPTVPHRQRFPVCAKAECLRAAAQVREALDSTISPCDNLWNSTCGGWLRKYPLPKDKSVWNMKQQLVRREAERVRDLVATLKLPIHTGTVEWKLKNLYDACMDVDNVNVDEARPLLDIINDLDGWYILRNYNEADFEKNEVLQSLHVKYGVSPFFKISVQPNPNMPGQNTIRISPSGLGLPDKEYYYRDLDDPVQTAYREYIRDVVIYMSSTRNEATKFGTDMFFYEKRIAEITPDSISLRNPISSYNAISLQELKEINPIQFFDILQAMYPESNITLNTEVIVTSLDYLGQISQIIATTDRKTMNGYLIWTLVREYIPYLSSSYTAALDIFNSALYGTQQPLERWEMCARLVNKFMGLAINDRQEILNPITNSTIEVITEAFTSILKIVRTKITKYRHSELLYNHLKSKLSSIKLQIGVPTNAKEERYLKQYYLKLKILKSNLFESVKNGMIFQKKLEEKMLNKALKEDTILSYALAEIPKVKYSPSDHAVIIPRSLLVEPFFEENYPSSIVYGRLGIEIAEAIVASVLPYDSLWTSDRKILTPYHTTVNDSLNNVQSALRCLEDFMSPLQKTSFFSSSNETALNSLIHLSAIDVAREALKSSIENTEHIHQPSLENFEDDALFFITYAQSQCSASRKQQELYDSILDFELPQQIRLHIAWNQLSEFPVALGCSFNNKFKCRDIF